MLILKTAEDLRQICRQAKTRGQSVGLVPTMGALHAGHASLIKAARAETDFVVVSVFVNPTQFGPTEDLEAYPRSLAEDCRLAETLGADVAFAPSVEELYPHGEGVWVEITGRLTGILCGRARPTHFRGVATVVTKLFNLSGADKAYFGQKDGQQAQVITRISEDLFMPVQIRIMPIVREDDGLALSSRNAYLSPEQRRAALILARSLSAARAAIEDGETDPEAVKALLANNIAAEPLASLEYAEIYAFPSLDEPGGRLSGEVFLALAVRIGRTRLIDNIVVKAGG